MGGKSQELFAKIIPPMVANVLLRERLFCLLDQGCERHMIWVTGQAGAGKTTLITSYLKERKLPCVWYQVDEGDSDVATFFYYLSLAARKAAPRSKALPLLTQEYLGGIPAFTRRFFEDFYRKLKRPCIVVFDNYQEVARDSIFHEVVLNGLSRIPEGITVILLSRLNPPPCMTRFIANDGAESIGWEDLRLTEEESEKIVALNAKRKLTREDALQLHLNCQGWIAGLKLMLKKTDSGIETPEYPDGHVPQRVFDYFAGEIFSRIDGRTKDFLLKSAFLPRITASMATELTGEEHAEKILSELSRDNYFTQMHYHPELSYQYHSLFREFLLAFAQRSFPRQEIVRLQLRAAGLLQKGGQVEDAARLYIAAGQWDDLIRLIEEEAQKIWTEGRAGTLEAWIRQIPAPLFDQRPWLSYWLGITRLTYDFDEARGYLEAAFEAFKLAQDIAGLYESWCGIVDTFIFEWGNFAPLDRWIDEFDNIFRLYPNFPSKEAEIRVTACMLMALSHRQPDKRKFSFWQEKGRSLLMSGGIDTNLQLQLMVPLAILYLWIGDSSAIAVLLNHFQAITPRSSPFLRLFWNTYHALYCWITGRPEEGLKSVADGLRIAESTGVLFWNTLLYNQGAVAGLALGDWQIFAHYMGKIAAQISVSRPLDICHYHLNLSIEALSKGELQSAIYHAEFTTTLSVKCGAPWPIALNRLVLAEVLFRCGDSRKAFIHLALARQTGRRMGSAFLEYNWLMARSFFAYQEGKEAEGLKYLKKFMRLGNEKKYINTDLGRSGTMSFLCMKALDAGIEVNHVRELIRRRKFVPDISGMPVENWPYPLKLYTLGRFEIVRDGKRLSFTGKVQQKPLMILKALIARGGQGVSIEHLIDDVWPDSQGDLAHQSFDTALHRLRKLVGEEVLQIREGQLLFNELTCWVDARAFEQIAERINGAFGPSRGRIAEDEVMRLAYKAIDLYKGHFLPADSSQGWSISTRERLRSKFFGIVTKTGEYFEDIGNYEKAIEFFHKGLDKDDLAEGFYRRLMICHKHLGQEAEAVALYRRCRVVLSSVLGINPSSTTEEIYRSIVRKA